MQGTRIVKWLLAAGLAGLAADRGPAAADARPERPILVFAAASTTNAVDELRKEFTKATGTEVQTSFASSATLAQQIANGADADVFLSADSAWVDFLAKRDLVAASRELLGNRLVVVVPSDSTLKLARVEDLAAAEVRHLALGDPQGAPAGKYAKEALKKLGVWDQVEGKVVGGQDVRHALAYVETGAAEAGIVYATDAVISKKVRVAVEIPAAATPPIRYPAALLRHGEPSAAAKEFFRYLTSREAARIFQRHGFTVLPGTPAPK